MEDKPRFEKTPFGHTLDMELRRIHPKGPEVDIYSSKVYENPDDPKYDFSDIETCPVTTKTYVVNKDRYAAPGYDLSTPLRPAFAYLFWTMEKNFPEGQFEIPGYKLFIKANMILGYVNPIGAWAVMKKELYNAKKDLSSIIEHDGMVYYAYKRKSRGWAKHQGTVFVVREPLEAFQARCLGQQFG